MHDINVIGSLQLLAACAKSDTLQTIVIRGSAGVYGAEPQAPQFFTEDMVRLFALRTRFQRDVAEIENYFEAYARRHPHLTCTMLRYQPAIGPSLDSQVSRYLSLPACPTYLGFDLRIQLVHEADALGALVAALGLVPLPSRWRIAFLEPIDTSGLGAGAAADRGLVLELSERVRATIQAALYDGLLKRGAACA